MPGAIVGYGSSEFLDQRESGLSFFPTLGAKLLFPNGTSVGARYSKRDFGSYEVLELRKHRKTSGTEESLMLFYQGTGNMFGSLGLSRFTGVNTYRAVDFDYEPLEPVKERFRVQFAVIGLQVHIMSEDFGILTLPSWMKITPFIQATSNGGFSLGVGGSLNLGL